MSDHQECISFGVGITALAAGALVGGGWGFVIGMGGAVINIGLEYSQGDGNGAASGQGFAAANAELFAMERLFPERPMFFYARRGLGTLGVALSADGCVRSSLYAAN